MAQVRPPSDLTVERRGTPRWLEWSSSSRGFRYSPRVACSPRACVPSITALLLMLAEPRSRALFVFVGKRGHTMKVLTWDGTGTIVIHKKLARGRFELPRATAPSELHLWISDAIVDGSLIPSRFDADVDRHVRRRVEDRAVHRQRRHSARIAGHRQRLRFDRPGGDDICGRRRRGRAAGSLREAWTPAWWMCLCRPSRVVPSVPHSVFGLSLLRPRAEALHAQLRRREQAS